MNNLMPFLTNVNHFYYTIHILCNLSYLKIYLCLIYLLVILSVLDLVLSSGRKEGNVLFNDALNTFYLQLYGVRHMVKDHSDSERGNPLPPHRLLFPISDKGSFICTIPQTG